LDSEKNPNIIFNVKFSALFESGVKNRGSNLKNDLDLQMTLKIDLKVKTISAIKCPPLSSTILALTIFLYLAYLGSNLDLSIKMIHPVYYYLKNTKVVHEL